MRGARGNSCARSSGFVVCSDSASAGLMDPSGNRSNTRRSPTVENTRFFVARSPSVAEQRDGVEHVVEVVRRFAHAHEHDAPHALPRPRERDLRHDLAAREVAREAVAAGHAEHAADGAADLRRDADAVAGQQHALDRAAVVEREQEARRGVGAAMLRTHRDEAGEPRRQRGQGAVQRARQLRVLALRERIERQPAHPRAQHQRLVPRPRAGGAQRLAQSVQ